MAKLSHIISDYLEGQLTEDEDARLRKMNIQDILNMVAPTSSTLINGLKRHSPGVIAVCMLEADIDVGDVVKETIIVVSQKEAI